MRLVDTREVDRDHAAPAAVERHLEVAGRHGRDGRTGRVDHLRFDRNAIDRGAERRLLR